MTPEEQQDALSAIRHSLEGRSESYVLLVEDDERDGKLTIMNLEHAGVQVRWATNLHETISILEEIDPKLCFLDLKLVGSDCIEVLKTVREKRPQCGICVLTGHNLEASEEWKAASAQGVKWATTKPLTPEQIKFVFGNNT